MSRTKRQETNSDAADGRTSSREEPRDAGCRSRLRAARRSDPARLRPDHRLVHPPHPGPARAGGWPHGRGLCPRHRASWRGDSHERARRDERRDAAVRRLHGLDSRRVHHRPGALDGDRHRCLPGGGHDWHHHGRHEAQLAHHRRSGHPPCHQRGVPRRDDRASGPGAGRPPEGRVERDDGVVLARVRRPAGLPAGGASRPGVCRGGRGADRERLPPGHLCRRRCPQGTRLQGVARARRAAPTSRSSRR